MYSSPQQLEREFLRPLCEVWRQRVLEAKRHKEPFNKVAKQCMDFFRAGAGFMWGDAHRTEFFNGKLPIPKFRITVALAYEYVSIYGPHLFWDNADRKVFSQRKSIIEPWLFGDVENDQQAADAFNRHKSQEDQELRASEYVNRILTTVLNWSQREQPGGMVANGRMSTVEALVCGMGMLAPETYSFPGSEAKYPRSRHVPISKLYLDPDAKDPLWQDLGYMVIEHVDPIWQVERKFNLPRFSLYGKGTDQSSEQVAREQAGHDGGPGNNKNDKIRWYEIWSRCGIGPRTNKLNHSLLDVFDDALGDYAYLCIAEGIDYPLNCPSGAFMQGSAEDGTATEDEIMPRFEWRTVGYGDVLPLWMDNRWPIEPLIFERMPNSVWPLPPLAPGLGELIAINILTAAYIDMTWDNRTRIVGYLKSCIEDIKVAMSSDESTVYVPINDNIQNNIQAMIQFLDSPKNKDDILQAIMKLTEDFNRRVGLTDLMRGMEGSRQIRVAADVQVRSQAGELRPEKMSMDVAAWMSAVSQSEMMACVLHCKGQDLKHLLGEFGAQTWDELVKSIDIETLMRETKTTVEASEIRRPNHERDTANVQALQQYLTPILQGFAQQTTNTDPLNGFLRAVGDAMEMDVSSFLLPPWQPPANPQMAKLQEAAAQADVQDTQAAAAQKAAAAKKAEAETIATLMEVGAAQNPMLGKEAEHAQKLKHNQDLHVQKLVSEQETHVQSLLFAEEEQRLKEKALAKAAARPGSNN